MAPIWPASGAQVVVVEEPGVVVQAAPIIKVHEMMTLGTSSAVKSPAKDMYSLAALQESSGQLAPRVLL